jgi:hypothetical protein
MGNERGVGRMLIYWQVLNIYSARFILLGHFPFNIILNDLKK